MRKLNKETLNRLLASGEKYMSQQLVALQKMRSKVEKIFDEDKHETLVKKKDVVCETGRDEDGDVINPDTEEALDWLDNEGVPNIEELMTSITDSIDEPINYLEEKLGELREIQQITPKNAFKNQKEEDEDEDEDEDENEEDKCEASAIPPTLRSTMGIVREAVRTLPKSSRFGPDKVFISDLWEATRDETGMDLIGFKKWLIQQNRQVDHLDLARADLVGAMDPKQVRESEINDLGSSFHFVVDRQHR
jgi:hypothetical protein